MTYFVRIEGSLKDFKKSKCFLGGFLEGACKGFLVKTGFLEGFLEGSVSLKALRRCSEGRNTSFCRARPPSRAVLRQYSRNSRPPVS